MATAAKTYTFTAGTTAAAAEVNRNFDDCIDFLNGSVMQKDGSVAFTGLPNLSGDPVSALQPTTKQYVDARSAYYTLGSDTVPATVRACAASTAVTLVTVPFTPSTPRLNKNHRAVAHVNGGWSGAGTFTASYELWVNATLIAQSWQVGTTGSTQVGLDVSGLYVPVSAVVHSLHLKIIQYSAGALNWTPASPYGYVAIADAGGS